MLKENMDEQDVILEFSGITKSFPGVKALDNVTFSVKRGTVHALVGENGAGKSTILKIITGVLNPTRGEVEIDGRISALLELGAGFNMEYTGLENVYLNGTMKYIRETGAMHCRDF